MRARLLALGAALVAVAGLPACSHGPAVPPATAQAEAPGATISWALDRPPTAYNPNTPDGDTPATTAVLNGVLGAFWRFRPDGTAERNGDFGTYQKISNDPLTIRYTIDRRAVWSDGVAIDCDDVALAWLANSGVTGPRGFASDGVGRLKDMNRPKCQDGDKVVTVSYRTPTADWATAFGPGAGWLLPAHVVQQEAGLHRSFAQYLDTPTSPDLAPAIDFWNRGWTIGTGPLHKDLMPSSGPYVIDAFAPGQSITLTANPRWWGRPPVSGRIVVRFVPAAQQVQALVAGQVQAIDPLPDPDVLAQLKAAGAAVRVSTGYRADFEHLDFNVRGAFADRTLREAFARCLPRRQIVDRLVKPVHPAATVLDSRLVLPYQPAYPQLAEAGRPYDTVDVARARALLAGRKVTVRIGWRKDPEAPDQQRLGIVAAIRTSCAAAGFSVVDAGTPTFLEREWAAGGWDVALMAWNVPPTVTGQSDIYVSGGATNRTGYASPAVDALFARLAKEPDAGRQTELLRQIDAALWTDLASVPLFAYPAVLATSPTVSGLALNPTPADLGWNVGEWRRR